MIRKLSAIVAYTIVVVAVTVFATQSKKQTPPTPAQVIAQLEKQFRANPTTHRAEVKAAIAASDRLDGSLLEHDLLAHAEAGLQLHHDNEEFLDSTHAVLASMRQVRKDVDGCGCEDSCNCTLPCGCPITIQKAEELIEEDTEERRQQINRKRRALNFLFGTPLETDEECEPKNHRIPDEVDPPVFNVTYEAGLVPLPPQEN